MDKFRLPLCLCLLAFCVVFFTRNTEGTNNRRSNSAFWGRYSRVSRPYDPSRPSKPVPRPDTGVDRGSALSPVIEAARDVQLRVEAEQNEVQRQLLRPENLRNQFGTSSYGRVSKYLSSITEVSQYARHSSIQMEALRKCARQNQVVGSNCAGFHQRLNQGICDRDFKLPPPGSTRFSNEVINYNRHHSNALPNLPPLECPFAREPDCGDAIYKTYRSIDGTCNNYRYTLAGAANVAMSRNLPAEYHDCLSTMRKAKHGGELPSARRVSQTMFRQRGTMSSVVTSLFMSFAQTLDHDLDHTPVASYIHPDTGESVEIECGDDGCATTGLAHVHCEPIVIPRDDRFFNHRDKPCLPFVRSQEFLKEGCKAGPREQPNQITSFIDGSFLYGSSQSDLDRIREYRDGKMKVSQHPLKYHGQPYFKDLLPLGDDDSCRNVTKERNCFKAGDSRQNTQVGLQAFHTIFMRYHNYIADNLKLKHRSWDDSKLFHETRKILVGVWQNVIYNEFLPITLGPKIMKMFDLKPRIKGYYTGYTDDYKHVNPDVSHAFATAAYRFGHTLISDKARFADFTYSEYEDVPYSFVLFNPTRIYYSGIRGNKVSGVNAFVLGSMQQRASKLDLQFTDQITDQLFTDRPPKGGGMDLSALNIQRGRDHGLKSYVHWRKWCKNLLDSKDRWQKLIKDSWVSSFDGLRRVRGGSMQDEHVRMFKDVYRHVEDLDLFAAGLAEDQVYGGLVGPTFACILAKQFSNSKRGDRFYYENPEQFSHVQLAHIKKQTLSSILCATLEDDADFLRKPRTTLRIQKFAMLQTKDYAVRHLLGGDLKNIPDLYSLHEYFPGNEDNELKLCRDLPSLDFNLF